MKHLTRWCALLLTAVVLLVMAVAPRAIISITQAHASNASPARHTFNSVGNLDCNGFSQIQSPLKTYQACTDPQGYDGGRAYDNGHYIGHDEPSVQFASNKAGSGNNVMWHITLPRENPLPATQSFENYVAFWFSMALCDPGSYPQNSCTPDSDTNVGTQSSNAAGSAFLEMQFYPPGFAPFITQISCDQTHWCASLHINSLECTYGFASCNPACLEPTNFAFIQMDGVPTGPAGPVNATNATFTPNAQTLLMNQGDKLTITIKDTPQGLMNKIVDQSTGQSGYMVASADNGFQSLDVNTCAPTSFSFHPEYSTAKFGNFVPWAALQANVGFAMEIGHFTPGPIGDGDADDPPCFPGPTVPGCIGADTDFDGTSYLPDWPDGTAQNATSLQIDSLYAHGFGPSSAPNGSDRYGSGYPSLQFETDVLASESTCTPTGAGCVLPPPGAAFYPFYAQTNTGDRCAFTFGNDIAGQTVNDFGGVGQYGASNLRWFYGTASSGIRSNSCTTGR